MYLVCQLCKTTLAKIEFLEFRLKNYLGRIRSYYDTRLGNQLNNKLQKCMYLG